jgi:predicted metal-dependent phosphoesterase TrpH
MQDFRHFSKRILFNDPAMRDFKKDFTFVDMHVHTKYSHDSLTPIKYVLKKAAELKIGLAITDHIHAQGSIDASKQRKVLIIPGIEINSRENKEILLYFYSVNDLKEYYDKYIKNKTSVHKQPRTGLGKTLKIVRSEMSMREIIEKANHYNCVKSIPHPYTYYSRSSHAFFGKPKRADLLKEIDAVEVLNASQRKYMNKRALKWAIRKHKAFTGGSDAHNASEIGSALVASKEATVEGFLDSIRNNENFVLGREIRLPAVMREVWKSMKDKRKKNLLKFENTED